MSDLADLLVEVRACTVCAEHLPAGPRSVLQVGETARIVIIGQAPGRRVHESGVPWDDPSGDTLRGWLGVTADQFDDPGVLALVPMGFCYPGSAHRGTCRRDPSARPSGTTACWPICRPNV